MKRLFLLLTSLSLVVTGVAQKYTTEKSRVSFFSSTALENIDAWNEKSVSLLNATTGEIAFSVPVADFQFKKSLMKEHFNEKYMETEKYAKAKFQGKIAGFDPAAEGSQDVQVTGTLSMHGVTNAVTVPATLEKKKDGGLQAKASFKVKLADYKIIIPQLLWQNIAEEVTVTVDFTYKM